MNKLFFVFMISIFSFISAGEKIEQSSIDYHHKRKLIEGNIKEGLISADLTVYEHGIIYPNHNYKSVRYDVKDIRYADEVDYHNICCRFFYGTYQFPDRIDQSVWHNIRDASTSRLEILLRPVNSYHREVPSPPNDREIINKVTKDYPHVLQFEGDSYAKLTEELQNFQRTEQPEKMFSVFLISLIDETKSKGLSFWLNKDDFEYIIKHQESNGGKSKFCMQKVLKWAGIGGLAIFLICYFNLYSKVMALPAGI